MTWHILCLVEEISVTSLLEQDTRLKRKTVPSIRGLSDIEIETLLVKMGGEEYSACQKLNKSRTLLLLGILKTNKKAVIDLINEKTATSEESLSNKGNNCSSSKRF